MLGREIFRGIKAFQRYETLGTIYISKCNKTFDGTAKSKYIFRLDGKKCKVT